MSFKIGLIGAGGVAAIHASNLRNDSRANIHRVYDPIAERSQALTTLYGGKPASSMAELLETCDAVYICTPNTTHVDIALEALAVGKNVLCEKPFALTLDCARHLRKSVQEAGVIFQVGHNRRFAPVYKILKQAIDDGALLPLSVHAKMNRGELVNPSWVWNAKLTGGFLYETPVHMFDLMRYFFGDVEWVQVAARAHEHNELDDFSILLGFHSGMQATMKTFAHASWHFPFERFEVYGMHSTYETFEMERIAITAGLDTETVIHDFSHSSQNDKWGYIEEDKLFLDALEGKSPPPVTEEDGYRSVELIDTCYKSARSGRRLTCDETPQSVKGS